RPLHSLGHGMSISEVILVPLPKRLCIRGRNLLHIMAKRGKLASNIVSRHSRFDANEAGWQFASRNAMRRGGQSAGMPAILQPRALHSRGLLLVIHRADIAVLESFSGRKGLTWIDCAALGMSGVAVRVWCHDPESFSIRIGSFVLRMP